MKSLTSRHPPSAIQVLLGVCLTGYLIIIAFDSAYRLGTAVYSKLNKCYVSFIYTSPILKYWVILGNNCVDGSVDS